MTTRPAVTIPKALPVPDKAVNEVYTLEISGGSTFEKLLAAGKYDIKQDDVTSKYFPVKTTEDSCYEAKVFFWNHAKWDLDEEGRIAQRMSQEGYTPACTEHLLAFGAKYPELQQRFRISALYAGCVIRGFGTFLFLYGGTRKRGICHHSSSMMTPPNYHLGVRKIKK